MPVKRDIRRHVLIRETQDGYGNAEAHEPRAQQSTLLTVNSEELVVG
jgi:hypothetical protein